MPVIVYSDGIGDTVMSLPALRCIAGHLACPPIFVANPVSLSIVKAEGLCGQFLDRPTDPLDLVPALRGCDLFITLDPDREALYSRSLLNALNPRWSIGWSHDHACVLPKLRATHFVDEAFQMASVFEADSLNSFTGPPALAARQGAFARELYSLIPTRTRVVVVHAETGHRKMWPCEKFRACLARFLTENENWLCLAIGVNPVQLETGATGDRQIDCAGLSLGQSMSLIGLADLFVGVDSGMLHVADSYCVPSIGVFGPSDPVRWGLRFASGQAVVAPGGDLSNLSIEPVLAAMQDAVSTLPVGVRRFSRSAVAPV